MFFFCKDWKKRGQKDLFVHTAESFFHTVKEFGMLDPTHLEPEVPGLMCPRNTSTILRVDILPLAGLYIHVSISHKITSIWSWMSWTNLSTVLTCGNGALQEHCFFQMFSVTRILLHFAVLNCIRQWFSLSQTLNTLFYVEDKASSQWKLNRMQNVIKLNIFAGHFLRVVFHCMWPFSYLCKNTGSVLN